MGSNDAGRRSPRVLIVEDDAEVKRLLGRILADLDIEITECGSAPDAVAAFSAIQPDLVLMDVGLPGDQDGISLTRQILTLAPSAAVLIVTNHNEASLRRAAFDAGACGYVLKEDLVLLQSIVPQYLRTEPGVSRPAPGS